MGILKKLGLVSAAGVGTVVAFSYKPKRIPTPSPVLDHTYKWNPNHHQILEDTHEIRVSKDKVTEKDLLVGIVKGYFSSFVFQPQLHLMNKRRNPQTVKKEIWEIEKLKREDLQIGNYLFDDFEVVEVEDNKVWLRFKIGVFLMEIEDEGNNALFRMSAVMWHPREDKPVQPTREFYAHLLYQRLLMQAGVNNM